MWSDIKSTGGMDPRTTDPALAGLLEVAKVIKGMPEQKWLLIAPNGSVWFGDDPMVLAAQASLRVTP